MSEAVELQEAFQQILNNAVNNMECIRRDIEKEREAMNILLEALGYGIIAECSLIKSHRQVTIDLQAYGCARFGIGSPDYFDGGYDDVWDFPSPSAALRAWETWNPDESPEPDGWHRHYVTGRYRP